MDGPEPAAYSRELQLRRSVLLLLFFYIFLTYLSAYQPRLDPDLWWHLATGRWIFDHGQLPHSDPFSQYGEGRYWAAYSWLFEVVVYGLYSRFGLVGVVYFKFIIMLLIGGLLWDLLRRISRQVFGALLLTALALYVLLPLNTTRPWLITVLFITIMLHLLVRFRERPSTWALIALPPLFALWANLHVQFLYGLILLGAFWADRVWEAIRCDEGEQRKVALAGVRKLTVVGVASALAALLNPYGWGVYWVIQVYLGQADLNFHIAESSPLKFRHFWDWVVLMLAIAGFLVLGWRRSREPLPYLLLAFGVLQTFRMQRDVWWLALMTVLVIAGFPGRRLDPAPVIGNRFLGGLVVAGILGSLFIVPAQWQINEESLTEEEHRLYPAEAVAAVKASDWPGPLFNSYDWGGYLIWALPQFKVAMDGRTPVHGSERILQSFNTWGGKPAWAQNPELNSSRLVIAHRETPLTSLLRLDPRFEVAHEDELTAVFLKRQAMPDEFENPEPESGGQSGSVTDRARRPPGRQEPVLGNESSQ